MIFLETARLLYVVAPESTTTWGTSERPSDKLPTDHCRTRDWSISYQIARRAPHPAPQRIGKTNWGRATRLWGTQTALPGPTTTRGFHFPSRMLCGTPTNQMFLASSPLRTSTTTGRALI